MNLTLEKEKAEIMFKLARKENWGAKYDRTEHFKRFQNLNESLKQLSKLNWILIYKKSNFTGISLNPEFKKEIREFILLHIPSVGEMIK
ncbi:MAG: hypothetical protein Q7S27_04860 [Nanoarchaeota archaeon]|nr:hypothetical protein [Nanoarchaeota archaeon]